MKTLLINNPGSNYQQILMLRTDRGIKLIDIDTIVRIEAISNYSKLFFSDNKTLVVAKLLHWFEEQLSSLSVKDNGGEKEDFIRIHRTHLVNKKFIRHYQSGKIKLSSGEYIDVAKRKKTLFLKLWYAAA